MTIYAHWKETYTVTFDGNGGTPSESSRKVAKGEAYGELPTAEREGFVFDGWYTEAEGGSQVSESTTCESDQTVYAHWIESYTVTFDGNGGTPSESSRKVVKGEAYGELPKAERDGFVFDGWYTEAEGGSQVSESTTCEADVTIYAHWTEIYTVTFDGNGGTPSEDSKKVGKGEAYGELPSADRDGYNFAGWYTEAEGGSQVSESDTCEADVTLYAHWEEIPPVSVSFDTGGGDSVSAIEVKPGDKYGELPVPKYDELTFLGWYTKKSGGDKVTADTTCTGETTLYARWGALVGFGLVYEGAEIIDEDKILDKDGYLAVIKGEKYGKLPSAKLEGYTFEGWYMEKKEDEQVDVDGDTKFDETKPIVLYARWKEVPAEPEG